MCKLISTYISEEHQKPVSVNWCRGWEGNVRYLQKGDFYVILEDDTALRWECDCWLGKLLGRPKHGYFKNLNILKVNGFWKRGDGGVTHIMRVKLEDLSHLN